MLGGEHPLFIRAPCGAQLPGIVSVSLRYRQILLFSRSVVSDSLRPHGLPHARLPCLITNSRSLLKLMCIELVMPSNHLILCRPLLLLPPSFPASGSLTVSRLFTAGESVLVDPCRLTSHILDWTLRQSFLIPWLRMDLKAEATGSNRWSYRKRPK